MTQAEQIRKHLNSGRPLTGLQALNKYGAYRLSARIYNLRQKYGEDSIYTERRRNGDSYIAVYHGTSLLKRSL